MNAKKNKGFTLIELIIAMSILSIVLGLGYNIINKSGVFTKNQQDITNNQSIANLVNTYLTQDIEKSIDINPNKNEKIEYENNTYKYMIAKKDSSVEYKVTLDEQKNVYSLLRTEDSSSIEIVTNQLRNDKEPFTITLKENGTYEVKISYSENKKPKEYSFSVSSRIALNSNGSNGGSNSDKEDVTDEIKPSPDDMPQLPSEIGANTHFVGFWMANSNIQKEDNIYTWIDKKYAKGTSNNEKNSISANIRPGNNGATEYSSIENTKVSGSITGKSDVQEMSIYVSKGTTVEDFEIQCGQGSGSIKVKDSNYRSKMNLSGGANDGKWYTCEITGKINTFDITSGKLSINKDIVDSGYMLVVYSKSPEELGDADIIFEYRRNYENPMNSNQYNMTNSIKVRDSENSYTTVDSKWDNAFNESIQTRISNYTHEGSPNILLMTEKSSDKRIYSIYGIDIKKTKKVILTLEGNIFLSDISGMKEIIPNKQYELELPSGVNFDRYVKISRLAKGESGILKVNLIGD